MGTHTPGRRRRLGGRRLGVTRIVFFVAAAAGPLFAIAGGVPTTYAVTGNVGVPLSFALLTPVLALFAVGYAAMSRYVTNAGAFYPYVANGIGGSPAVAVSFVTIVAYSAIQISIYGMFGWSVSNWARELFGIGLPWGFCALVMVLVIGLLGILKIDLNSKFLGVALGLEVLVIVIMDIALLAHPARGGGALTSLTPDSLLNAGAGAVFAFSIVAFIGIEGAATYGEESPRPSRTVGRATFIVIGVTAVLYFVSSLAMAVATGPGDIVGESRRQGPELLFVLAGRHFGEVFCEVVYLLFITSQFASLLSLHNLVARHFFALGREGLLPRSLSRTNRRTGAPLAGSVTQSVLALVVVAVFALAGLDPVSDLFAWLGTTASAGVVIIMIAVSWSVVGFFHRRKEDETFWRRALAPSLAAVVLTALLVAIVVNFDVLLGRAGTGPLRWILPGLLLVVAVAGFLRGELLRTRSPEVYAGIGGVPETRAKTPEPIR